MVWPPREERALRAEVLGRAALADRADLRRLPRDAALHGDARAAPHEHVLPRVKKCFFDKKIYQIPEH